MARLSSGHPEDRLKAAAKPVYRVRSSPDSHLFTDSVFVFTMKTAWARLTTPKALQDYYAVLRQLLGLILLTLATIAAGIIWVLEQAWHLALVLIEAGRRGAERLGRDAGSLGRGIGQAIDRGVNSLERGTARLQRGADRIWNGVDAVGQGVGRMRSGVEKGVAGVGHDVRSGVRQGVAGLGRGAGEVGRGVKSGGLEVWADVRGVAGIIRLAASAGGKGLRSLAVLLAARLPRLLVLALRGATRFLRAGIGMAAATVRGLRCRPVLPTSLALACVLLLVVPVAGDMLASLADSARSKFTALRETPRPEVALPAMSIPEISIPKVTFHKPRLPEFSAPELRIPDLPLPDISIGVPGFVASPVRKLDEALSGPLVEPGARVLVPDFAVGEGIDDGLGRALALALEGELGVAHYFSVMPRERALATSNGARFSLPLRDALELAAGSAAAAAAAVVAGRLERTSGWYTLTLVVLDPAGVEIYNVAVQAQSPELLSALDEAAARVRRRLGEPRRSEETMPPAALLSASLPALQAFAQARALLHSGRYYSAIAAAQRAVRHDSEFAAAHRLMADAYALTGQRSRARVALDAAWRHRARLADRERLRLAADREALAGRYSQAITGYDRLFSLFRDDVGALKSQAVLQRMIGARGRGTGNLRVAYAIDPVDWPPLERVARFLGYRGHIGTLLALASASGD